MVPLHHRLPKPPGWLVQRPLNAGRLLETVATGPAFSISRWGDGEWYSIINKPGRNSDLQPYHGHTLGKALGDVLRNRPPYILGLRFPDQRDLQRAVPDWLVKNNLRDFEWTDGGLAFHSISIRGRIGSIFHAMNCRPLILVGPPHLNALARWMKWRGRVETPLVDAWAAVDRLEAELRALLDGVEEPQLVSFSCGMTAKVLIDRIYRRYDGKHFLIDFGAIFDPYCGTRTRKYHKHPKFTRVVKRILEQ